MVKSRKIRLKGGSMGIYFERNFNKALRGYNTEEVDAALDAIVIHCDELEDANREFAEENNRLIDDNSFLKDENEHLKQKLAECTEKLKKIEETYNTYRQKYGEAKDMIERAKKNSLDILSEANEKAQQITDEAKKQGEDMIAKAKAEKDAVVAEFDAKIFEKNALLNRLDEDFAAFKNAIREDIAVILAKLEMKDVEPAKLVPQKSEKIAKKEEIKIDPPAYEPVPEDLPTIEEAIEVSIPDDNEPPEIGEIPIIPFPSAINEVKRPESEFSKVKNTLEGINNKVKNNKSTPHIN